MQEQRQHPRHHVTWRVAIFIRNSNAAIPGKTQEISLAGAGILQPLNLAADTPCRLIFEIPSPDFTQRNYLELEATVIYTSLVGSVSEYRTGFKFKQTDPRLKAFLDQIH